MTKTHHSVRDLRKFRTAAFADITPDNEAQRVRLHPSKAQSNHNTPIHHKKNLP